MALFFSIACLILVLVLYRAEKKGKTKFTPVFSLGFIFSVIMILVAIYDIIFDTDYKMSLQVPLYSALFIFEFWIIGKFITSIFGVRNNNIVSYYQPSGHIVARGNFYKLIKILLIILFLAFVVNFFLKFGFNVEDSDDLKSYYSQGIFAHIIAVISVLFLVISTAKRPIRLGLCTRIASILWVLVLALTNSKYSMFMYAISLLIIYTINYPKKFSFRKIILYIGIIALAFFAVYILRFLLSGASLSSVPYSFIFDHFVYYISSGYYAFSYILQFGSIPTEGVGVGVFFAPIINIFRFLTGNGELVSSISEFTYLPLPGGYERTNVYTIFGALWLEMGIGGAIICVAIVSILAYTSYSLFLRTNNKIVMALHSYVMATLVFGFFNCFYGTLNVWEMTAFITIIAIAYDMFCTDTSKQLLRTKAVRTGKIIARNS